MISTLVLDNTIASSTALIDYTIQPFLLIYNKYAAIHFIVYRLLIPQYFLRVPLHFFCLSCGRMDWCSSVSASSFV